MATKQKKPSAAEIRAFRHKVSLLKKKGLVSKRTDARKQKPTRYMKAKVAALAEVLNGTQTSVKLDRATAKRYQDAGFLTFGNRVVVSKGQLETVRRDKGSGLIVIAPLNGRLPYEKVVMPYSIKNIDRFMALAQKSPPDPQLFAAKKNPQDHWAFTYHGNNSLGTFADLGLLAEHLVRYINLLDDPRNFQYFILYRAIPKFWMAKLYRERDTRKRATRSKWAKDRADERRATNKQLLVRGRETMQVRKETYEEMNARHQRDHYNRQKAARKADATLDEALKKREREKKANARKTKKNRGK